MSELLDMVDELVTDRDIYSGLSCTGVSLQPDNIVAFSRAQLRQQDYAGTAHHRYVLIFFLSQPANPEQALAERINRYIHDHVAEQFRLQDLACHCRRSVSHLRLTFRRVQRCRSLCERDSPYREAGLQTS